MPLTVIRMLLNHFRWDKEKLMERYYDGDQEKLFTEARVVNPLTKSAGPTEIMKKPTRTSSSLEECGVSKINICSFGTSHNLLTFFVDLFFIISRHCDVWTRVWSPLLLQLLG